MKQHTRLAGAVVAGVFAAAMLATAAFAAVKSGTYHGTLVDDGDVVTIEVGKKEGKSGKFVTNFHVELTEQCDEDLEFTKDAKIEENKFKLVNKELGNVIASAKGTFKESDYIEGSLKEDGCDGLEDAYWASRDN